MGESQLTLTAEERECLVRLLETARQDTRVEERRTRAPEFRDGVIREEHLIAGLLERLRPAAEAIPR